MKWANIKGAIIIFLVIIAILGGSAYTLTATNNLLYATEEIDLLYSKLESSNIAENSEKYQALNEIIGNKNAIDKTYFDALSGGFFAVSLLISIASFLSSFKSEVKENQQSFKMNQKQFDHAVEQGALRIDISSSSNLEFSDSPTEE